MLSDFSGADQVYVACGYGQFDRLAAAVVRELKERHPAIRSVLVLPYLDRKYDVSLYDESIYRPWRPCQCALPY